MELEDVWSILKFTEGLHSDAWDPLGISEPRFPQPVSPLRDLVWIHEVSMNASLSGHAPTSCPCLPFFLPPPMLLTATVGQQAFPESLLAAGRGARQPQGRPITHNATPDGVHPALGQMSVNGCNDHPVETHYEGPKNRGPQQCMALGKPRLRGSFR